MEEREMTEEEIAERERRFTTQKGDLTVIGPDGTPLYGQDAIDYMEARKKLLEEIYGKSLEEEYEDRIKKGSPRRR